MSRVGEAQKKTGRRNNRCILTDATYMLLTRANVVLAPLLIQLLNMLEAPELDLCYSGNIVGAVRGVLWNICSTTARGPPLHI